MEHSTDILGTMNALEKHITDLQHWHTTVFQGAEMPLFIACLVLLQVDRELSAEDIADAIPGHLDRLPLEGCEMAVLETMCSALRERGQTDDEIAAIAEGVAAILSSFFELVLLPTDERQEAAGLEVLRVAVEELARRRAATGQAFVAPCCVDAVEQQ